MPDSLRPKGINIRENINAHVNNYIFLCMDYILSSYKKTTKTKGCKVRWKRVINGFQMILFEQSELGSGNFH